MFVLQIELLTGVYRAGLLDGSSAEWPPHPERVFSALVQAWSDGGFDGQQRAALEWLESLPAPLIEADSDGTWHERDAPTVFVPPNDQRGADIAILPDRRLRQARSFRAAIPVTAFVRMAWQDAPTGQHKSALVALAHRVASLGHSASLVRFAFADEKTFDEARLWRPDENGDTSLRVAHKARLSRLEDWFAQGERPLSDMTAHYCPPGAKADARAEQSVFGGANDWFVFEDEGGFRPDILAFAHVAKAIRAALMVAGPQPVPEIICGHNANGEPSSLPHLAIVPLANVGWEHATGDLLGFAVVLPRTIEQRSRDEVLAALAAFAHVADETPQAKVCLSRDAVWRVSRAASPSRSSLKPERWCAPSAAWASVTPMLLDRFPDRNDVVEEARLIAAACRNIGLPEPVEIEIHKHSAIAGVTSAYPARGNPRRPDWSFPEGAKFAKRPRRHVVLRFAEKVEGPLMLGAGRFHGLGLCLPLKAESGR